MYMIVYDARAQCFLLHVERALDRTEWSRTSISTASAATANAREGGRCCVAHASSRGRATWGWGVLKGGRSMLRRCSGGAAGEARAASAADAAGAQRLQRAAQSAAHDPRPTPSAAPSHARRSTLCTLTDQLLLSGPPLRDRLQAGGPSFSAVDGSRTIARDRRRDGLGTDFPPQSTLHGDVCLGFRRRVRRRRPRLRFQRLHVRHRLHGLRPARSVLAPAACRRVAAAG